MSNESDKNKKANLHNFIELGLKFEGNNMASQIVELLLNQNKTKLQIYELFDVVTRHFCEQINLPLLIKALKRILNIEDQNIQTVSSSFS